MPVIDSKNKKIIYNENDWLAGLHPQSGSKTIPQKFGKFASQLYAFNPYINLGYASNGYYNTNLTDYDDIKTRLVAKSQDDNDSDFYALEDRDYFHIITDYTTVAGSHQIVAAAGIQPTKKCYSICRYVIGGNDYYFYSYRGTAHATADVGRFAVAGATYDDDYMSTVPTGASFISASPIDAERQYCPLIVGHDDVLYAGGYNYLAAFDGPTTTLTPKVLTLESKYNVVDLVKYPPRSLVIFAQGDGNCKAYFWDYLSQDPYDIKDIKDFDVMGGFEYQGTVGCITRGRDGYGKIKIFDGSEFKELTRFPLSPLGRELKGPVPNGIFVNDKEIWFNMCSQREQFIYCYGNNFGMKQTLNVMAKGDVYVSDGITYYPGIMTVGRNNETIFSSGLLAFDTGDGSSTQRLDLTKYATDGYYYSDLVDMGDERIQVKQITVYFADEFTGGRTITMSLFDRHNTYDIAGLNALGTVTTTNRIYKAKPILNTAGTPIPPLDGFGIKLTWGQGAGTSVTPTINKIIIDYEPIKIN
jgi:hypothetical protein